MKKSKSNRGLDQASWALIRRLIREHIRPYIKVIAFSLVCMAIAGAATAGMAKFMEPFFNKMLTDRSTSGLYWAAAMVLGIFFAKGIATFGQQVSMNWVGQRVIADIQSRLYDHVIGADLAYFQNNPTGELISRFTNDVARLQFAVSDTLTGFGLHVLTLIFLVAVMFHQDPILAAVTFFVFPIAILPIVRIGRRMRKISTESQEQLGHLTAFLSETFQGARHVKAYGMENHESERARSIIEKYFDLCFKSFRTSSAAHPIMETLGGVAIVAVIIYGGHMVISGGKTPGQFISFATAVLLAYAPAKRLAVLNATLQQGLAAAKRIFDVIDRPPSITDKPDAAELVVKRGRIRFDKVSFAYNEEVSALKNISLTVPEGQTVALVGPSGAGKSTIMNLIPRFYDVDAGKVTIDGVDLREVTLASLRANIGLVSQEISLFDDTVRANIGYGKPDASEDEIVEAARRAAAHDFIMELPRGYDTNVGGMGTKLSGGQRQRVAIARAMLKNAPILLLDEATSALDTESERKVQAALAALTEGRTTLVIAHRLSTVLDADLIYVIDAGRVIESGDHAALIAQDGAYARLYAMQLADGEADVAESAPAPRAAAAGGD